MAANPQPKPLLPTPVLIGVVAASLAGAGLYALARYGSAGQGKGALSAEAKAYTRNLKLSGVELKATTSYLGQEVIEIAGKITNAGDRPVTQVDLNCVFYDRDRQVVLRERVSIVRPKFGGLNAGETKGFRLPFDSLPRSWNQSMPQLVIAQIVF